MKTFDEFHDGFLDGLLVQGTTLNLFLRSSKNLEFVIRVSGVSSLQLDGFRQGNIICDVLVRHGHEINFDHMMSLFEFSDDDKAVKKLTEVREKGFFILEINPSYGATCTVLANAIEISPGRSNSTSNLNLS